MNDINESNHMQFCQMKVLELTGCLLSDFGYLDESRCCFSINHYFCVKASCISCKINV